LGGEQVAADEDALQKLDEEKHKSVKERFAQLKCFLVGFQFFEDCTEEKPAEEMRTLRERVDGPVKEKRTAGENWQGPVETSTAHSA
jgi:hypothetical protein